MICDPKMAFEENNSFQSLGANRLSVLNVWRLLLNRRIKLNTGSRLLKALGEAKSGISLLKLSIYGNDLKTSKRQNGITSLEKCFKIRTNIPE